MHNAQIVFCWDTLTALGNLLTSDLTEKLKKKERNGETKKNVQE